VADNAFECTDRHGVRIVCSRSTWDGHIVAEHPEMQGCESCVVQAVEAPQLVYQDRGHPDRRVIYRRFILPEPYQHSYLRVVVDYKKMRLRKRYTGYVLTAFPVENTRKGDTLLWSQD
jgi:hypothetical protein